MSQAPLIRGCNGEPILSVEDWLRFAPPKRGIRQWKDFRSAKECAKAWFRNGSAGMPSELSRLLDTHPKCSGFVPESASPECKVTLDNFPGETRNADMVVVGNAGSGRIVVCIEAKADEEFGPLIGGYLDSVKNVASNVPARIRQLSHSIFGKDVDSELASLHYQLLHAYAASIIAARQHGADQAVFVVHEFRSSGLDRRKLAVNEKACDAFVAALMCSAAKFQPGKLFGPFAAPGGEFVPKDVICFFGKALIQL